MIKKIHKIFFIWQFDKEEKWLNEMSASGLQLRSVGLCTYHFEQGSPGEYIYRLELLDRPPTHISSVQYIHFVEDTGVEHVGSLQRWVYFRKKASLGGFDLFSDYKSRIKHLNRILLLNGAVWLLTLANCLNMSSMWIRTRETFSLTLLILMSAMSIVIAYGLIRILLKRHVLKKEHKLHE